jgi:hypothetical protein
MQMSFTPPVERLARRLFPGQVAIKLVAPQPYEHDTFTLEVREFAGDSAVFDLRHNCREQRLTPETR